MPAVENVFTRQPRPEALVAIEKQLRGLIEPGLRGGRGFVDPSGPAGHLKTGAEARSLGLRFPHMLEWYMGFGKYSHKKVPFNLEQMAANEQMKQYLYFITSADPTTGFTVEKWETVKDAYGEVIRTPDGRPVREKVRRNPLNKATRAAIKQALLWEDHVKPELIRQLEEQIEELQPLDRAKAREFARRIPYGYHIAPSHRHPTILAEGMRAPEGAARADVGYEATRGLFFATDKPSLGWLPPRNLPGVHPSDPTGYGEPLTGYRGQFKREHPIARANWGFKQMAVRRHGRNPWHRIAEDYEYLIEKRKSLLAEAARAKNTADLHSMGRGPVPVVDEVDLKWSRTALRQLDTKIEGYRKRLQRELDIATKSPLNKNRERANLLRWVLKAGQANRGPDPRIPRWRGPLTIEEAKKQLKGDYRFNTARTETYRLGERWEKKKIKKWLRDLREDLQAIAREQEPTTGQAAASGWRHPGDIQGSTVYRVPTAGMVHRIQHPFSDAYVQGKLGSPTKELATILGGSPDTRGHVARWGLDAHNQAMTMRGRIAPGRLQMLRLTPQGRFKWGPLALLFLAAPLLFAAMQQQSRGNDRGAA